MAQAVSLARRITYRRPWLYPAQQAAIFGGRDIQGQPARIAAVEATTKAGKAQPLSALVYTPRGPVPMGALQLGDTVLTPGGSANVVGIYPQGIRPIYKITFSDGVVVRADAEHLWEVHQFTTKPKIVTTSDLLQWRSLKLRRAWVPRITPAQFASQPVPLDPYLVGILIGDGSLSRCCTAFSSADQEIIDAVRAALPLGHYLSKQDGYDWRITAHSKAAQHREDGTHIRSHLRRLGLLCLSHEKRIPDQYRYNSVDVRKAILQGILDTDGFVDKHGQPGIEQTSEALAKDIEELVQSLGGTVLTGYRDINGYRDKNGAFIQCRPVWRQVIRFQDARWCFRLKRKADKVRPKKKPGHRMFRTIEFDGVQPAQCIEIDCPRHLYLTNGFTPTHNTASCIAWLIEQALLQTPHNGNCWWIAPVYAQAKIAFRRAKEGLRLGAIPFKANEADLTITLPNRVTLWFKSGEKPDNLYGEDVYAAVIDEASRLREEAWFAVRSTLTATRGPIRIIGNVKGAKNWFFKLARRAEAGEIGYSYAKLTAYDAIAGGVLAEEEIISAKRDLPEAVFNELYLAQPNDDGSNPFGLTHIAKCLRPALSTDPTVACGVDLAKSVDWTVVIGLDRSAQMTGFDRWQSDWDATEKRIINNIDRVPTLIDSTGVGDPIVERIQKHRRNVNGFVFSSTSKQQLMERLAVGIQHHELGIIDGPVRAELENFEFVYTRTGVLYSAPEGYHDDCVMALALAYKQFCDSRPLLDVSGPTNIGRVSPWFG